MNYQLARKPNSMPSIDRDAAVAILGEHDDPLYYAWPEVFGSTTGPFKGIGGQAMTTFTVEAWLGETHALVFCGGRQVRLIPVERFRPGYSYEVPSVPTPEGH